MAEREAHRTGQVRFVEGDGLLGELDRLEERVEKITLPLAYTDELYTLRQHIHVVRKKLLRQSPAHPSPDMEPHP